MVGGGVIAGGLKKILIVNIMKFNKKVDKPRGWTKGTQFFLVKSRHFLMLFLGFLLQI